MFLQPRNDTTDLVRLATVPVYLTVVAEKSGAANAAPQELSFPLSHFIPYAHLLVNAFVFLETSNNKFNNFGNKKRQHKYNNHS